MKTEQLFIPEKIKAGFQKREGTYTGKLAYVIYFDQKGVLRKEKSWESWRDKKIAPVELENVPTEGFVLNKGVGGQRQSYGWNARNEYIRVYDPRDFEFEISVANLLFILRETDCSRGKGLEGKFVYAWEGTELVLLPVSSQDYQNSKKFTDLQAQKVLAKDLIPGATYRTKKQQDLVFVGRFDYHFVVPYYLDHNDDYQTMTTEKKCDVKGQTKKYIFWDGKNFVLMNELKNIAVMVSADVAENYPQLVTKYNNSTHGSKVNSLILKDVPDRNKDILPRGDSEECWAFEESDGVFVECRNNYKFLGYDYDKGGYQYDYSKLEFFDAIARHKIKDGIYITERIGERIHRPEKQKKIDDEEKRRNASNWYGHRRPLKLNTIVWREPTTQRLFAVMDSKKTVRIENNNFKKED